jgi:hypothetical protein
MLKGYLSETEISLTEVEKKVIMELGGGYPFFVQIAGNYMVEAKQKGLGSEEAVEEMVTQFDDQADAHFTYMWSHSSESEKINLLAIIALGQRKPSKKTYPTIENLAKVHSRAHLDVPELTKRGLLLEDQETSAYRMFSVSLERWILREISAAQGEEESEESVQSWLTSGGREELVPVSGLLPKFKKKYWPVVGSVMKEITFELASAATFELIMKMIV